MSEQWTRESLSAFSCSGLMKLESIYIACMHMHIHMQITSIYAHASLLQRLDEV